MESWKEILQKFILQAHEGDLKTASYPREFGDWKVKVSFGMGSAARVPWIGFTPAEMNIRRGIYPVYLYYKELETLVLAYGVSETEEFERTWPAEVISSAETIAAHFDQEVPRYGDSFVFKSYKIQRDGGDVSFVYSGEGKEASEKDIEADLATILEYYKGIFTPKTSQAYEELNQGLFYMEKQLEDFLVYNWDSTELGKRYDLIIEEGELKSQQFRTDIGPIDILAKDKKSGNFVVIELKKNQTSDDTIGQLARYMGWVREHLKDQDVRGVIIAGQYDRKLDYALKMVPNTEVFLYEVSFKLRDFSE